MRREETRLSRRCPVACASLSRSALARSIDLSKSLTRRRVLQEIAATAIFAPAVFAALRTSSAAALPTLPNLASSDALLLVSTDSNFNKYEPAYNRRTMLRPQLRALCKTPKSVAVMVDWARTNMVPFALRSGGHGYEGF